jgi:hypothetical protein
MEIIRCFALLYGVLSLIHGHACQGRNQFFLYLLDLEVDDTMSISRSVIGVGRFANVGVSSPDGLSFPAALLWAIIGRGSSNGKWKLSQIHIVHTYLPS